MNFSNKSNQREKNFTSFEFGYWFLICVSLLTLVATFLISSSSLGFGLKVLIFGLFILLYLVFGGGIYLFQKRQTESPALDTEKPESLFTTEIQEKLAVLEETDALFAASLKPDDMFRLAANRIQEMIPFVNCALFAVNENKTKLKIVRAAGENAFDLAGSEINFHEGLAGKTFVSGKIQLDGKLVDKNIFEKEILNNIKTAVAAPLWHDSSEVFGVLALYGKNDYDTETVRLLKEISLRLSPLLAKSLNYERMLEGSLKDALTGLPNERAFYLVLENQIAESRRAFEKRPLTILSFDIKNFDELNKKIGHRAADQILTLTAKIIKGQLRQMDFLARSSGDEFLAVLPTASEEVTKLIVQRIEKAFAQNALKITESEEIYIELNFGASSFIKDGETAQVLLKRATLNKLEAKSGLKGSVINFPREYIN